MVRALLCNPDFEMHASGLAAPRGAAAAAAEAVTRMMALCGPMGSSLWLARGQHLEARDGDALRREAAAQGLYREDVVARAPWNRTGWDVVPYAADARADALCGQLGLPPPQRSAVTQAVNSKAFSLSRALGAGLEPGVFGHSLVVESVAALAAHLAAVPDEVAQRWTLKPVLGFAGGGRISGHGRTLHERGLHRLAAVLARDGSVVFEAWVDRVEDLSSQLWVDPRGEVSVLMHGALFTTLAGRYVGNGHFPSSPEVRSCLRDAALQAGAWLAAQGYVGPAGVDAFRYQDPLTGAVETRALVEINARFTLGLLSGFVASMAFSPSEPWFFALDESMTFGRWSRSAPPGAGPDVLASRPARGDVAPGAPA